MAGYAHLRGSAVANRVVERLDQQDPQAEERLETMRPLRVMVAEDPAFVIELQDLLLNPGEQHLNVNAPPQPANRGSRSTSGSGSSY